MAVHLNTVQSNESFLGSCSSGALWPISKRDEHYAHKTTQLMKVIHKELTKQFFKRLPHYVRRRKTVKVHEEGGFSLQTITNWRAAFSVSAVFSIKKKKTSSKRQVPSKALMGASCTASSSSEVQQRSQNETEQESFMP